MASVSGFLLTPEILPYLRQIQAEYDGQGELMIQPAIQKMIDNGYGVYAKEIQNGKYYDTGDKLEYVKTVIDFSLMHDKLGPEIRRYLQDRLAE